MNQIIIKSADTVKRGLNKFFLILALVGLSLILALSGCKEKPAEQKAPEQKVLNIGAILPLTGDLASYGQNSKDGIELAAEEVNSKSGLRVEVFYEDSKGQPQEAVSAMQKLLAINRVSAIIGDVGSSPTLAMAPIANQRKVVILSPAASSSNITGAGEFIFRIWPSDDFEAKVMADYVKLKGYKRIAVAYVNNDYGKAMLDGFKKRLRDSQAEVVAEEAFMQNATDMRAQLTRVKASRPDALYLISYPKDTIVFLGQFQQLGLRMPILSTSSFEDPQILKTRKIAAEGAVFSSPLPPDPKEEETRRFKEAYRAKFGKDPGLVADYAYDALKVLVEAAQIGSGTDGEAIKRGLKKIKDFKGASGLINFDANGDVVKQAGLKKVFQGKYVWLTKEEEK